MLKTKLECESALINYFDAVNKLADDDSIISTEENNKANKEFETLNQ